MKGPEIVTHGCRLNIAESETMRGLVAGRDDLVIVNSCAVTAAAVKQARQAIRRAARGRPDARIVVTGCAAELDPAAFAAMPGVTAVVRNADKGDARSFMPRPAPPFQKTPGSALGEWTAPPHAIPASAGVAAARTHTRAFVEVQNGCDHRCTFCIIPHARGPSRSVPAGPVIDRIKALVDRGCREVVLTGVDMTSYGPDLPAGRTLGHLVDRILRLVSDLPRLRLSSLDSVEIDDRLFALLVSEPRLLPHVHLSLQHGDDLILKRMKRRHTVAQAIELVARLKAARPAIAIGADLIAGFPTESEPHALATLALLDACDIVFGHIFPYSPRPGTPAARMPQLDPMLVRARAARLRAAADTRRRRWLGTLIGSTQQVLVEAGGTRGHAGNHAPVRLSTALAAGAIVALRITHVEGDALVGDSV